MLFAKREERRISSIHHSSFSFWHGVSIMKFCKPLIGAFTTGTLLFGGALFAQDMSTPPPAPVPATTATMPSPNTADMRTPRGEVIVNSAPANAPAIPPAPSFEQLSGGGKAISQSQAQAYAPLANDFIHADSNRVGKISKTEYLHWLKQL
jgi:hypothetical protein